MIDNTFHGIGMLLNDDFTVCLAIWREGKFNGPVLAIMPDEKIFYGEFTENEYDGFMCYHMGAECQIYCLAKDGQIQNPVAAVFPLISSVLELSLGSNEEISTSQ